MAGGGIVPGGPLGPLVQTEETRHDFCLPCSESTTMCVEYMEHKYVGVTVVTADANCFKTLDSLQCSGSVTFCV